MHMHIYEGNSGLITSSNEWKHCVFPATAEVQRESVQQFPIRPGSQVLQTQTQQAKERQKVTPFLLILHLNCDFLFCSNPFNTNKFIFMYIHSLFSYKVSENVEKNSV